MGQFLLRDWFAKVTVIVVASQHGERLQGGAVNIGEGQLDGYVQISIPVEEDQFAEY